MADPEQTAKNVLAILGQIDDRLSSISNKVTQINSAGGAFAGSVGGGGGGGNGAAVGAAGGSGGRGGGLGLALMPNAGGGGSQGGGGGQGNLGLGRVALQAAGSALGATLSRFGSDRVSSAVSNQILANQFSIRSGQPVSNFLYGKQLFQGLYGYNTADLQQAASIAAQQAVPGSALYRQITQQLGQESLRQPGFSQAQVAQVGLTSGTPQNYNQLRLFGINGVNANGIGKNASQLASTILAGSPELKNNAKLINQAFAPGGILQRAFSQSGYSADEIQQIQDDLVAQATGRVSQQSQTADASTKKRATSATNKNLRTDQGVATGAQDINDAATKLNKAADAILGANQALADTIGVATGASQQSGSKAVGAATAFAHTLNVKGGGGFKTAVKAGVVPIPTLGIGGPGASPRGLGGAAAGGGTGSGSTKTGSLRHVWPVGPGGITQAFGAGSEHHPGVDFGRVQGTPIHAAADGDVIFAGAAQGFGSNFVAIFHSAENKVTRYGHGSAKFVSTGDKVVAGQVIAAVGMEGYATGPHLHLELANGSNAFGGYLNNLDPIPWLGGAGTSTSTAPDGGNTSSSSSSGQPSGPTASTSQTGFGLISLSEGLTSSLLQGGGAHASAGGSSGSSSSSSSSSSGSATSGGALPGDWAKKLPAAGQTYASLFAAAAKKYGINPAFLAAVADTESSFNPSATNPKSGAAGLFQFIPSTAQGFGINAYSPSQATDAAAKYLSSLLQSSGGNVEAALNSYSGGGGSAYFNTVEGFFSQFGGGKVLGSFDKGSWELDRDQVAMVHKGEMIVPKGPAEQLRQRSRGGSGVNINVYLQNTSNGEAMRLVQVVQKALDSQDQLAALGSE